MPNTFRTVPELEGNLEVPRNTPEECPVTRKDVSAHCAECIKEVMFMNVLTSH